MSKKYNIGQVLYIISPKTQAVIPVQVQEINQRTTIEGEQTLYMIMDPNDKGPFDLNNVGGDIYTNTFEVSEFLKSSASKAIDSMVADAEETAKLKFGIESTSDDVFPSKPQLQTKSKPKIKSKNKSNGEIKTTLPTGDRNIDMVEVIDKDGKSNLQKTKIRVTGLGGEVISA